MPFDVLSPDGFSIHRDKVYKTLEEAIEGAKEWVQSYAHQGYYSSFFGRIALSDLLACCDIIEIPYRENHIEEDDGKEINPF
jgi:hypothetical protein